MEMAMEQGNNVNFLGEHPLLNSLVLKQVFQYLKPSVSLDTLKSVRQVCTVWRDDSLGLWREIAVLKLTRRMMKDPQLTILTRLLEVKPFQRFKLKDVTVNMVRALKHPNSQANRFWTSVGPHVKHLTLEGVNFTCRSLTTLMEFLICLLPNLNTLVVEDCTVNGRSIDPTDGDYERLQHPKVVSLSCTSFDYFAFKNFPNLQHLAMDEFEILHKIQLDDGPTLKHLDIILPEGETLREIDGTLGDLRSIKYPVLERLSVDYRHWRHNSSFKFLPEFLKNHCENLKTLEVKCFPYVRAYSNFPFGCQLDRLTELRLWGNVVEDLSFLKFTPKLKVLHMDVYGLEKQDSCNTDRVKCSAGFEAGYVEAVREEELEGVVLHDMEYLQINCRLYQLEPIKSLKRLGEWMPNLKTLKTVLEPGFIAVICDQWPLLEHLVGTHGSVLGDDDIIGNYEAPGKKGLKDLVELKTFHLNASCGEGRLTDKSVRSGFLKMGKLTDLQVCVSDKFSDRAEKLLQDGLYKVIVIRNYSGNEEHKEWKCCKDKAFIDFLEGLYRTGEMFGSFTIIEDESDWEDFGARREDGERASCWNWNGLHFFEGVE